MGRAIILVAVCIFAWAAGNRAGAETLFVGGGDGIYAVPFDPEKGRLGVPVLAAKLEAPTCLAAHPGGWFLVAASNGGPPEKPGASQLVSYFVDPNAGSLHEINRMDTAGSEPADVEVDVRRGAVFVASFGGGAVAGFPLAPDGTLGARALWIEQEGSSVVLPRQAKSHPSEVRVSPDSRYLYVPDFGTDDVFIYEFAGGGHLRPAAIPSARVGEGDGPRHLDFHPRLPVVYLTNEISSRITAFQRDPTGGSLTALQSLASVPRGFHGENQCSAIRVHPGGAYLYASNCGHNSIAVYRVDGKGILTLVEHRDTGGKMPRDLVLHSSGKWLVSGNQESGNLAVFAIHPQTGVLQPSGDPVPLKAPGCMVFAPAP